ncbi:MULTISPECIES: 3-oxoacyl-ACP synthase [unclassified Arenibacter]|jgi:transcription elongation GreA/GreB family factor|uniref:3-oxoacyl-ACP synthase n=1 Tax=unclassified Arenibacter TaxID=2615047 RepID=UPI000E34BDE4|nr:MULTISPECIES: 3-oxoacyl-ACP synthase [unclassified Arenibacter]MCM4165490.1 3-oxoacyl-ACP synthase [Arenibacter sp. A80]RFT54955.1 3-oxoacyl-ACP synthase [Arenibacter sp. P308M17]
MEASVKQQLNEFCKSFVENRFVRINSNIDSLQEALTAETKSSAGDKHETGRAMIQLEREKLGHQLAEVQLLQELFKKIPLKTGSSKVGLGSVVYTDMQIYYMGVSAGELKIDGVPYFAIAPNTPIGKLLLGKVVGDIVVFNTRKIIILKIE